MYFAPKSPSQTAIYCTACRGLETKGQVIRFGALERAPFGSRLLGFYTIQEEIE